MKYYLIRQNWRRIKPHLPNPDLQRILARDMAKFTPRLRPGMKPFEVDRCDWRFFDREDNPRRGRAPAFWDYACQGACHWIANFSLKLAELVEAKTPWRIVTTQKHSTVWDGAKTLFDINFLAIGVNADEAWKLASKGDQTAIWILTERRSPRSSTYLRGRLGSAQAHKELPPHDPEQMEGNPLLDTLPDLDDCCFEDWV